MRKDIIYGALPDMFAMSDGKTVSNVEDWRKQRDTVLSAAVELEFGGMPPKPEVFSVEYLSGGGKGRAESRRITCGTKDKTFTFCFRIYRPDTDDKVPVVITGDENYTDNCNDAVIAEAHRRGYAVVKFDRTELAPDRYDNSRNSGIYPLYPELRFTAISAWAWGYHRVIDALSDIDYIDTDRIAVTGHSRGGKTALLAGATDERIRYVNPNCSGSHGCGCWRFYQQEEEGLYSDSHSETMEFMFSAIRYWMGDGLEKYIGNEAALPHDMHFIKALVAPRILLETNGYADIWANPRGSYITYLAAKKAWTLYGNDAEKNCLTRYRDGGHGHGFGDFCVLFDVMDADINGTALPEYLTVKPYNDMDDEIAEML